MRYIFLSLVICAIEILSGVKIHSGEVEDNYNAWFNYFGDHSFGNGPWGLHLDSQIRRTHLGTDPQQILIQPGINYELNSRWIFGFGYGYMRTYPYGDYPVPIEIPEHRIWEQASTTTPWLGVNWNHRLRIEQRYLGQPEFNTLSGKQNVGSFRYENRIRYRLMTVIPFPDIFDGKFYLKASDEVFLNVGRQVANNQFDQNRAYIGLGRRMAEHLKLELGFMEQTLQHRDGKVFENNHTVMVSLFSDWSFNRH